MVLSMALLLPMSIAFAGAGATANAAYNPSGFDFWVTHMGPIKIRIFRAADGNTSRALYLLDGLRARNDRSAWEIETNVAVALTTVNINVVMPVGGESSFYADWIAPSNFNGQPTYKWETFLTQELPWATWRTARVSRPPTTASSACRWVAAPP